MHERLSLLLPVWERDRPDFLDAAFRSTVLDQTRRPDHVVIVRDGPVPAVLADRIADLVATSPVAVDVVELDRNVGLGPALDIGLTACRHDVVARMDADDISLPQRFAVQMPIVEAGADIVGSGLLEFGEGADDVVGRRIPPTDPDDIRARSRFADPFNHPTVVYRRACVQAVGGYGDFALMEDYLLWAKMIARRGAGGERRGAAGALPGRRRGVPPPGWAGSTAHRAGVAAAAARPGVHDHVAVRAQRRRPRWVPVGARRRPAGGLPAAGGPVRRSQGSCRPQLRSSHGQIR